MLGRLTRDFRAFYREPITPELAASTVSHQLETRDERFLAMVERAIFRHAGSPYLQLFRAAGCELGDLRHLVAREGLEGALRRLSETGVYVTIDELKGRREAVRGSRRFAFSEADFDNPHVAPHLEDRTGGSRGAASRLELELGFIADRAITTALAYDTHGLRDYDRALWLIAGLRHILQYTKAGRAPVAWFQPVRPVPVRSRALTWYVSALGRLFGHALPTPTFLDLQDPGRMAQWLATRAVRGRRTCLTTYASSAVRVCAAARAMGVDLGGVAFMVIGEPYTEARKKVIEAAGAYAFPSYAFNEAGTVAFGCAEPRVSDDVHLFGNLYGLVSRSRPIGDSGLAVDAFLVTSLLSSGPKVLLNAESGDYGVVERRRCGCRLGALGLDTHLGQIRSFEKLTTEGMTFAAGDLLRILDEVLPARFGGTSTDYQLIEQERAGGLSELVLIVSPAVGAVDEDAVRRTFLDELRGDGTASRLMAGTWERAGSVTVRRQGLVATRAGKILPFHLVKP